MEFYITQNKAVELRSGKINYGINLKMKRLIRYSYQFTAIAHHLRLNSISLLLKFATSIKNFSESIKIGLKKGGKVDNGCREPSSPKAFTSRSDSLESVPTCP